MKLRIAGLFALCLLASISAGSTTVQAPDPSPAEMTARSEAGVFGGRLVIAQRAEPKTLHPVFAIDNASREVIRLMTADLIHINRLSQMTEPALAESWSISKDGRKFTLPLRQGLRFSDGHPLDVDDVTFTFQVHLDEKINSPQRDLLLIEGKPISVTKAGPHSVQFQLAQP